MNLKTGVDRDCEDHQQVAHFLIHSNRLFLFFLHNLSNISAIFLVDNLKSY